MLTKEHISQYPHAHLLGIIGGGDGRVAAVLGGAPVIVSAKIHVGGASVTRMEDARPSLSHRDGVTCEPARWGACSGPADPPGC